MWKIVSVSQAHEVSMKATHPPQMLATSTTPIPEALHPARSTPMAKLDIPLSLRQDTVVTTETLQVTTWILAS